ncbi:254_t:CDS:1, partial [Scutellospora calospora]
MPSTITTICYITDQQETTTSKALIIVKASRVLHLRNSTSPLNIFLVEFYFQNDDTTDSILTSFLFKDVVLVFRKFRFVEDIDKTRKKFLILK